MKQLFIIFTIIVLPILFISCEKPDEEAPTVTILTLQENDVVYEIVIISCIATDNEAIEKVELWLDGEYAGISDNTEPYKLEWNTTEYENRTYVVTVRVYDVNGNKSDSDPINIRVDNNLALPTAVNVLSVTYTLSAMTVNWNKSQDSDFVSYTLLTSNSQSGNKTAVTTITDINSTSYSLNDFDPTHENWFWIKVTDTFGYENIGSGQTNPIDSSPLASDLYQINYDNGTFIISWSQNSDVDFQSYTLYESISSDMDNKIQIYDTNVKTNTSYTVAGVILNSVKYYQIYTTDIYGLISMSKIGIGVTHDWFVKSIQIWNRSLGNCIIQSNDNNYIITGYAEEGGENNLVLIKIDKQGSVIWYNTYNYNYSDIGNYVYETVDNGFIITGKSGGKLFLIKTDYNGNPIWNKFFGGSGYDEGYSVKQTMDGGYIIAGERFGKSVVWVIKTDLNGNEEWSKTWSYGNHNAGYSVIQTLDNGYIVTGYADSYGVWLIKLTQNGNEEWSKRLSGSRGYEIEQTSDGNYIIAGIIGSNCFLMKVDSQGNEIWYNGYDIGGSYDRLYSIEQTVDGGYIATGYTNIYENGDSDVLILKTDFSGNIEWHKVIGGTHDDEAASICQTDEEGFVITGYTKSFGNNTKNMWVINIDSNGNTEPESEWE